MLRFNLQAVGRVGQDPVTREVNGASVTNFSVAVDTGYTNRQTGEKVEGTQWINCAAWNGLGVTAAQYLHKGEQVLVAGTPRIRTYTDQSGRERVSLDMTVTDLQLLANRAPGEGSTNGNGRVMTTTAEPPPVSDDDIPF